MYVLVGTEFQGLSRHDPSSGCTHTSVFMSDPLGTQIQHIPLGKDKELEIFWGAMKIQGWYSMIQGKLGIQLSWK